MQLKFCQYSFAVRQFCPESRVANSIFLGPRERENSQIWGWVEIDVRREEISEQAVAPNQGKRKTRSVITVPPVLPVEQGQHNLLNQQHNETGLWKTAREHINKTHNWHKGGVLPTCSVQDRVKREQLVEQSRKKGTYRYL